MPANVQIVNEFFDNDSAQYYHELSSTRDVLFISDIRCAVPNKQQHKAGQKEADDVRIEQEILVEMKSQEDWIFHMQCKRAMLKFRLPYQYEYATHVNTTQFLYVQGEIRLQAWAPRNSTECRLVVEKNEIKQRKQTIYDCVEYEQQMCWINNVHRAKGLDQFLDDRAMSRLDQHLREKKWSK